ncbi:hypothetical protein Ga0080574_TMP4069 [Salipiger abyssi]|uniref:Uncharacterized protein n=1 Tax=Salipiger abyssi TaxID=1250539 RepID=A0A1P8UYE0_9RHOB|nr:hypothetical protein Ga0080574_TMP4069 [Salipiger abyssi]
MGGIGARAGVHQDAVEGAQIVHRGDVAVKTGIRKIAAFEDGDVYSHNAPHQNR